MVRTLKKSVSILLISMIVIAILSIPVHATHLNPDLITPNNNGGLATSAKNIAGTIIAVVQVIGVSVAIIMLIVLAIKYLSSAPNDRAEIKKHAVVYVVGAVILFATSGILGIIRGFAINLGDSSGGAGRASYIQSQISELGQKIISETDSSKRQRMIDEMKTLQLELQKIQSEETQGN